MPTPSSNNVTPNKTPAHLPAFPSDTIRRVAGDFGLWQLRTALIIFLCKIPSSWFMACIIFTAPELAPGELECESPTGVIVSHDQCHVSNSTIEKSVECEEFNYYTDFYSLIVQFDLVCSRDILVAWTQYWHLFGILVGGVLATKLMNYFSPRKIMIVAMILQITFGVPTGYVNDFNLHCFFRCLAAVCCSMMMTSGQTIFTEITGGKFRTGLVTLYDTFWSVGLFFLPTLASFFTSWSQIYLGISFPTLILLVFLKWIPEAPRWLLKNDADTSKVEKILLNAARVNDRLWAVPENLEHELQLQAESLKSQPPPSRWLDLWKGPRAKMNFIAAHVALACFIVNFMGMLLNTRSFGRDYLAVNTITTGFSEIVGCFVALYVILHFNQWKWQIAGACNILTGLIGCLGWLFQDSLENPLREVLLILIASIPKSAVSIAQSMLFACLAELVPTTKKQPFVFSAVTWARIWLLTAPFVGVLKRYNVAMSLTAFCVIGIVGGIATFCLRAPNTLEEPVSSDQTLQANLKNSAAKIFTVTNCTDVTRL